MTQFQSTSLPLPAFPTGIVRSKGTRMCGYLISRSSMRSNFFFFFFPQLQKEDCPDLYAIHAWKTTFTTTSTDYIFLFRWKCRCLQRHYSPVKTIATLGVHFTEMLYKLLLLPHPHFTLFLKLKLGSDPEQGFLIQLNRSYLTQGGYSALTNTNQA